MDTQTFGEWLGLDSANSDLPASPYERAMTLRNGLIGQATGSSMDATTYKLLRTEFMEDGETHALLPQFVRTCRETGDFWEHIKAAFSTYAERRTHLREAFDPLLTFLERRGSPAADAIADVLLNYSEEGVHRAWNKALKRSGDDPEGAITSARTLLESVCKHILDDAGAATAYKATDDLPKLYRAASERLNLAPSQHTEDVFKRVLGGCTSVIEGLGSIRNKVGDAHGQGRRQVRVSSRHAHLAVNLAGSMAMFLERFSISLHHIRRRRSSWRIPVASRGREYGRWRSIGHGWSARQLCAGAPSALRRLARSD